MAGKVHTQMLAVAAPHAESSGPGSVGGCDSGQRFSSFASMRCGLTPIAFTTVMYSITSKRRPVLDLGNERRWLPNSLGHFALREVPHLPGNNYQPS